jgi:hypothetical protein
VSDYESNLVPRAVSLKHELVKRIPTPVKTGSDAGQKGWTSWEMYDVANDLEKLANQLLGDKCSPTRVQPNAK